MTRPCIQAPTHARAHSAAGGITRRLVGGTLETDCADQCPGRTGNKAVLVHLGGCCGIDSALKLFRLKTGRHRRSRLCRRSISSTNIPHEASRYYVCMHVSACVYVCMRVPHACVSAPPPILLPMSADACSSANVRVHVLQHCVLPLLRPFVHMCFVSLVSCVLLLCL